MANTFSKSLIVTGKDVQAWHVTQSIDAFTGVSEYNLQLSGSFTLTGSLQISGSIVGSTLGSASYSLQSTNASQVANSNSASLAEYNLRGMYTLNFFSPITESLQPSTTYGMGGGEILNTTSSGYYGITIPVSSSIVSASYVSTTLGTPSNDMISHIDIMKDSTSIYTFHGTKIYKSYQYFKESIPTIPVSPNDRIWIRLTTNDGTIPTQVAHNLTLYLRPE